MNPSPELLPCPFCGGEAAIWAFPGENAYVCCRQCGGRCSVTYPDKFAAVAAWNTRSNGAQDVAPGSNDRVGERIYYSDKATEACIATQNELLKSNADRIQQLEAALLEYGDHKSECCFDPLRQIADCDCGFSVLRAALTNKETDNGV